MNLSAIQNEAISTLVLPEGIVTCPPDCSVLKAAQMMAEKNIGCIIVVVDGRPKGIFTERDLLKKCVAKGLNLDSTPIHSVMTPDPVSVTENVSVGRVLTAMRIGRFRHIIVNQADGRMKTIVSVKDMIDWVVDHLAPQV